MIVRGSVLHERRQAKALAENRLSREIKNFTRPKLLVIDEVGYLSLELQITGP